MRNSNSTDGNKYGYKNSTLKKGRNNAMVNNDPGILLP
jgi:hypothetical protein